MPKPSTESGQAHNGVGKVYVQVVVANFARSAAYHPGAGRAGLRLDRRGRAHKPTAGCMLESILGVLVNDEGNSFSPRIRQDGVPLQQSEARTGLTTPPSPDRMVRFPSAFTGSGKWSTQ